MHRVLARIAVQRDGTDPPAGVEEVLRCDVEARIVGADVAVDLADDATQRVAGACQHLFAGRMVGVVLRCDQCGGRYAQSPFARIQIVLIPQIQRGALKSHIVIDRADHTAFAIPGIDQNGGRAIDTDVARCRREYALPVVGIREILVAQVQRRIRCDTKVMRIGNSSGGVGRRQLDHRAVFCHGSESLARQSRQAIGRRRGHIDMGPAAGVEEILRGDIEACAVRADIAVDPANGAAQRVPGRYQHLLTAGMRRMVVRAQQRRGGHHQPPCLRVAVVRRGQIKRHLVLADVEIHGPRRATAAVAVAQQHPGGALLQGGQARLRAAQQQLPPGANSKVL